MYKSAVTLSIGDGANDVSMIKGISSSSCLDFGNFLVFHDLNANANTRFYSNSVFLSEFSPNIYASSYTSRSIISFTII